MNKRLLLIPLAAAVAAGIAITASATTGANFSDTKSGTITGTIGSVTVDGSGGNELSGSTDNMDMQFTNLLPGTPQAVTDTFQNTGSGPEDIYVVFNNNEALGSLNSLGTFGEVHIDVNGGEVFASANLNDGATDSPPQTFTCTTPTNAGIAQVCPVPKFIKVATGLQPGATGNWTFQFNYASKIGNPSTAHPNGSTGGGTWNLYPASGESSTLGGGSGQGLPYEFVAEQPNIAPAV
jgi:hypothetical protein